MSYRRAFEDAIRNRDSILEDIKSFTESVLLDIVDCEMRIADGLARSGDAVGGRSGDVSRPTERAALRLAGREEEYDEEGNVKREAEPDTWVENERDVVGEAILEFMVELKEAAAHLRIARRKIPVVVDAGARLRGRKDSIDQCLCCDRDVLGTREDRLKAGFCEACYKAWRRLGMPDRFAFIRDRRLMLRRAKASRGQARAAP